MSRSRSSLVTHVSITIRCFLLMIKVIIYIDDDDTNINDNDFLTRIYTLIVSLNNFLNLVGIVAYFPCPSVAWYMNTDNLKNWSTTEEALSAFPKGSNTRPVHKSETRRSTTFPV